MYGITDNISSRSPLTSSLYIYALICYLWRHRVTANGRLELINHAYYIIYVVAALSPRIIITLRRRRRERLYREVARTHATHNSCGIYVFFFSRVGSRVFFGVYVTLFYGHPPFFFFFLHVYARIYILYTYILLYIYIYNGECVCVRMRFFLFIPPTTTLGVFFSPSHTPCPPNAHNFIHLYARYVFSLTPPPRPPWI